MIIIPTLEKTGCVWIVAGVEVVAGKLRWLRCRSSSDPELTFRMVHAGFSPSAFPKCAEGVVGERARAGACSSCRERTVSGYQETRAICPRANSNLL